MVNPFFETKEQEVVNQFLKTGYVIFPLENTQNLKIIRSKMAKWGSEQLKLPKAPTEELFFDKTQDLVNPANLNAFRMALITSMARDEELRVLVFSLARTHLQWIVGNELAMQRACNLSIQLPADQSSLLPIHCDTWQGNSPFEMVFWLPLVDCYKTKSMFILPREGTEEVVKNFDKYGKLSSEDLFQTLKPKLVWLDIPLGHGLIFSHAMLHGNRVNDEKDTRWSMNIRFKALFSPYSSKELGESFLPITMRPATRFGYEIKNPKI
jgi:sporadic carbohydrate cluster 2OG-Fe(II) oxygenase